MMMMIIMTMVVMLKTGKRFRNNLYPLHQYDEKVRTLGLGAESGKLREIVYHPHQQAS